MDAIAGLAYSPPVQIGCYFIISVLFFIALLGFQLGLSIILGIYSIASLTHSIDWIISKVAQAIRFLFPETLSKIEENLRKTFIFHGNAKEAGLYIWHPHGLWATSPAIHCIMQQGTNSHKMPLATLSILFRLPFLRDIITWFGFVDNNYKTLKKNLEDNKPVGLVVGGVEEMFYQEPKKMLLVLNNRKGYLKLAIETKKPLIPVLTFGENELYKASPMLNTYFNKYCKKHLGIVFPFITWESFIQWKKLAHEPLETVNTYVGEPILPRENETLESLGSRYKEALQKLFEKYKPDDEYTLTFI